MRQKLEKVRGLGYICPGMVHSLISYFAVPKGEKDIRMVYNGTKSGLNGAMWAPWFLMPTVASHLRFVGKESYLGDLDVGDMFHNFMLHPDTQLHTGIDLTPFFTKEALGLGKCKVLWEQWWRSAMGLKSSPYNCIQGILFSEEVIRGDPSNPKNVFRWDEVKLNLPGSQDYKPWLPWVSRVRHSDGLIACDFITYVDDTRTGGNSWDEARASGSRVASIMNWLGLKDAARKQRDPSPTPGPWAGSIVSIDGDVIS